MSKFNKVGGLRPGRSVFDLSYEKKLTCDMGQLIPTMCDEVVPGDIFKIGNQAVVRFQPLLAPILHEINISTHYFFVPYRLLWNQKTNDELTETGNWEDFITGGEDGQNTDTLPRWTPSNCSEGSLWDYLGFPIDIDPEGARPLDFPRRAYNMVYNNYYRDENLQDEVGLDNEDILNRAWTKDYFTSSLPWQQRGTAPALPISGMVPLLGIGKQNQNYNPAPINVYETDGNGTVTYNSHMTVGVIGDKQKFDIEEDPNNSGYPNLRVDLSNATTFDISDLRLAFQIQKWLERNARGGARYTEFLKMHFDASPRDDRLQRPEYIGGTKSPVIISEVLQTSENGTTPQGNLAGHGISLNQGYAGTFKAQEFGLIIGITSIMPKPAYQNGINRQWLRETKYDFYFPEFANLSEQAILNAEICAKDGDTTHNQTIFGYQGRYDEMRVKNSIICSGMRSDASTSFDFWHLARNFNPASPPELNSDFIECIPRKDIFAVPSEPGILMSIGNYIKAIRPMPIMAEPGLIDHN